MARTLLAVRRPVLASLVVAGLALSPTVMSSGPCGEVGDPRSTARVRRDCEDRVPQLEPMSSTAGEAHETPAPSSHLPTVAAVPAPETASAVGVKEFFDRQGQADEYASLKATTRELDLAAAERVNDAVAGDVLAIGGVWDFFEWKTSIVSLTVLDLSMEMLNDYCPDGATRIEGDLYVTDFDSCSFDTVVFPLMLHHTAQGRWRDCERRVTDAFGAGRALVDDPEVESSSWSTAHIQSWP